MVLAASYLLRSLSYGHLGLLFEKGFSVDENTDISQPLPFISYSDLTPLAGTATQTEILDAIFYERYIELFNTAVGSSLFDRRRTNQLQVGTFRHLPVPATELEVLVEDLYTLGGLTADPTGIVPHYNIGASPARTDDSNLPTFN